MNKFAFALIAVITLHLAVSEKACPLYKCMETKDDKCKNTTEADGLTTIEVKKCTDAKKECKYSTDKKTGTCGDKEKVGKVLVAGEECENSDQCLSGKCESNKCSSVATGGNCTETFECAKGNFCDKVSGTCKAQLSSGATCNGDDNSCPNDEGCLETCTKYYSLPKGAPSTRGEFCQSGFVYPNSTGVNVCAEKILNSTECNTTTSTCDYEIDTAEETKQTRAEACICNLVNTDKKFCPIGTNETHYKEYLKNLQQYVDNSKDLHTMRRRTKGDYDLQKKTEINKNYPKFENATDCIIDGVLNGMNYLKISFFGLMLFGLLF